MLTGGDQLDMKDVFHSIVFFIPKQVVFLVYISIIFHRTRKKKAFFFHSEDQFF